VKGPVNKVRGSVGTLNSPNADPLIFVGKYKFISTTPPVKKRLGTWFSTLSFFPRSITFRMAGSCKFQFPATSRLFDKVVVNPVNALTMNGRICPLYCFLFAFTNSVRLV